MSKVYLALYKGRKDGRGVKVWAARFADWAIRTITRSQYSHCEIAIKHPRDGLFDCYSASPREGGVRIKTMPLPSDKWDLIELSGSVAVSASRFYRYTHGAPYDWLGALGVVLKSPHSCRRWFCSEWCAYVIGYANPFQYSPHGLYAAVLADGNGLISVHL